MNIIDARADHMIFTPDCLVFMDQIAAVSVFDNGGTTISLKSGEYVWTSEPFESIKNVIMTALQRVPNGDETPKS